MSSASLLCTPSVNPIQIDPLQHRRLVQRRQHIHADAQKLLNDRRVHDILQPVPPLQRPHVRDSFKQHQLLRLRLLARALRLAFDFLAQPVQLRIHRRVEHLRRRSQYVRQLLPSRALRRARRFQSRRWIRLRVPEAVAASRRARASRRPRPRRASRVPSSARARRRRARARARRLERRSTDRRRRHRRRARRRAASSSVDARRNNFQNIRASPPRDARRRRRARFARAWRRARFARWRRARRARRRRRRRRFDNR